MATIQKLITSKDESCYRVIFRTAGIKPVTKTFKDKKTAQVWANQSETSIERDGALPELQAEKHTLKQIILQFQEEAKHSEESSIQPLDWWRHRIGYMTLYRISKAVIKGCLWELGEKGPKGMPLSPSTENRYHAALHVLKKLVLCGRRKIPQYSAGIRLPNTDEGIIQMMRKGMLRALLIGGCLLLSAPNVAFAGAVLSEIVVFSDSLSDNGNLFFDSSNDPTLLPDPPSPPYFDGRQSNGIIWVEYLAQALGLPNPDPSTSGGTNYAYSGATSGFGDRLRSSIAHSGQTQLVPEIGKQIDTYLSERVSFNDSQLVVEWSGANDLLVMIVEVLGGALDPTDPAAVANRFQDTFVDVEAQLRLLDDNGAKHVLVPNQPDSSKAPFWSDPTFAPGAPVLSQFVTLYNASLSALIAGLEADPSFSANLYEVDIYQAFNSLLENPDELGFVNTTDPALLVGSNGDGYVFWDVIHVTTDTHAAISDVMLANIPVPVPHTIALILLGVALVQFPRKFNRGNAAPSC